MNNLSMSHNKKRNVGIVYELLLRSVSSYLIEGEKEKAQIALDIISKRFSKDTELFKEFRLFNALAKTRVTDSAVSAVILTETKSAARRIDYTKLDREKSFLIRDINHTLNDAAFFHRRIGNYRELATIQVALNEWSLGDKSDLSKTILVETKLVEMLRSEPLQVQAPLADSSDAGINSLVIKLLNEKFNKKYKGALTEDQRALISDYVMMNVSGGPSTQMIERAQRIKSSAIETLGIIEKTEKNQIIQENLQDVRLRISSLDVSDLNDEKLGRLMTLSQLIEETKESK
jgi:hypothetical protein